MCFAKNLSSSKALLPPPRLAFRFPQWLTDLFFLVVSRLAFFFSAVEDDGVLSVCVRVRVCTFERVTSFPDLELMPFKTLLKTFMWD